MKPRVPAAAWVCAAVALLNALTWSIIVPLFQVPDEQAHVAYAQYLAETGKPPSGATNASATSEEERNLLRALRWRRITHRPDNQPLTSQRAHRRLERTVDEQADRTSEGGSSNATNNPPLYYGISGIAYRLSPSTDLPDRIHAMRFISALLAAITVLFVFLFLREMLPDTPWAWTVGALSVAFQPMFGFIGGGVNSDNLVTAAAAGVFYTLAVCFRRGLSVRTGAALGGLIAVGLLAKTTMFGLIPGIGVGLIALVVQATPERRAQALKGALATAAVAAVPMLIYVALNSAVWDRGLLFGAPSGQGGGKETFSRPGSLSGHLTYLWQFYLPEMPSMQSWFEGYPARELWFDGFIGRFGWLDYGFSRWVYDLGLVLAAVLIGLVGRELIDKREAVRARLGELLTYTAMTVGLLATLGWVGYGWRLGHPDQFEQARYLLPLLCLYGALIALAARGASRRHGSAVGIVIVSLAVAHSLIAMLMTLTRYYG